MADDDNFDIDIYGDDTAEGEEYSQDGQDVNSFQLDEKVDTSQSVGQTAVQTPQATHESNTTPKQQGEARATPSTDAQMGGSDGHNVDTQNNDRSEDIEPPKQAPVQQGVKREDSEHDRPVEPGASSALIISELSWWINDDDIRGWANQSGCEDELKEVTFSEHKVNGKSKGQVYAEFSSPQAATAVKQTVENFAKKQPNSKRHEVKFASPATNPFRTLPKDAPQRQGTGAVNNRGGSGNYNNGDRGGAYNSFRGGRGGGGMGGRGGNNNGSTGFNRNFSNPQMNGIGAGFMNQPMNQNFMNTMGNMAGFNRGGMMMNRGGRGGMNMMGNMAMGGMPMQNMGMPAQMSMAMGNMRGGFGGQQGYFNPNFQGQQMGGQQGEAWNPHGAKRPRPE